MHHKIGLATIATVTVNSSMEHAAVVLGLVPIPLGQTTCTLYNVSVAFANVAQYLCRLFL